MDRTTGMLVIAGALVVAQAGAQDVPLEPATDGLAEVTVSASRRESNLQTTPITVSAIGANELESQGASRVEQLADFVPNLYLTDGISNQSTLTVSLRGHGEAGGGVATSESPVAFYVDEVYQARLSVANAEFVDIERIEVLRGPQGALFGRNSMSGAIHMVTREPSATPEARVVASVGSYDEVKVKAGLSGPVAGAVTGSLAAVYTDRDEGYKHNVVTGERVDTASVKGVRGSLKGDWGRWSVRATGSWSDADNDGFVPTGIDPVTRQPLFGSFYNIALASPTYGTTTQQGGSLHINGDFGAVQAKLISAYSEIEDAFRFDISGGLQRPTGEFVPGYDRAASYDQNQWTHELQFRSSVGSRLQWIGGLYYFTEDVGQTVQDHVYLSFLDAVVPFDPTTYVGTTKSYAAYGQLDWEIADRWTLTLGGRQTREDKEIAGVVGTTQFRSVTDYSSFDPKLGVSFAASDQMFWYGTVSKGFRAGGFNGFGGTVSAVSTPFGEETVRAYEVGVKSTLADRRVRLNVALFLNDYEDLQSPVLESGAIITENAVDVRDQGAEFELTALLTEQLELSVAGGYQEQDFRRVEPGTVVAISGAKETANVPSYSGALGLRYTQPLGSEGLQLRSGATLTLRDKSYASNDNDPISENSKVSRVNAFVGISGRDDVWSLTLSGRNLTDEVDWVNGLSLVGFLGTGIRQAMEPRTWALEFGYRYGN